ncbi:acyl carrier protein [Nocardia sp. 004]|uniref:acyl carrier protein n=1 Tax=Nocardia sp. 004 TaxID=3385978 RepID=UPI00399FCA35
MSIEDQIRSIIDDDMMTESDAMSIKDGDSLRSDHGMDSLGFVELRVQCENKFGIRISDDDFTPENFRSVSTIAELVRTRQ